MSDPWHATDPALSDVLEQLKQREPIFHRPEFGTTREAFDCMMAPEFWETGASGQRYARAFILDELERRYRGEYHEDWETSEFACRALGADVYLLTYTLLQNQTRRTRRMTIWRRVQDRWEILYHQGTLVLEET